MINKKMKKKVLLKRRINVFDRNLEIKRMLSAIFNKKIEDL